MCCNFMELDMFLVDINVLVSRRLTNVDLRFINMVDAILGGVVCSDRESR